MRSMDVRRPLSGKFDSDTCGMALPFGKWRHSLLHAMAEISVSKKARLTGREREVAALVCNGLSNKIVAQKLNVSEGTIKIHLHKIFQKLGVQGRSELAIALLTTNKIQGRGF